VLRVMEDARDDDGAALNTCCSVLSKLT